MKLLKIYLFLILIKIILLVSCKKDPVNYCKTGSINAPYSNKFGYDNIGIQKKITFKINGQPFSLNCPETDKNEYFFIYYLHLKQSNFEPIQNFI